MTTAATTLRKRAELQAMLDLACKNQEAAVRKCFAARTEADLARNESIAKHQGELIRRYRQQLVEAA